MASLQTTVRLCYHRILRCNHHAKIDAPGVAHQGIISEVITRIAVHLETNCRIPETLVHWRQRYCSALANVIRLPCV